MTDADKIRRAIDDKLREQRTRSSPPAANNDVARHFGRFLSARCRDKGWSARDLARELEIELSLAEALLDGFLPHSEIDDLFLSDISRVIGCDFKTLKHILDQSSHV